MKATQKLIQRLRIELGLDIPPGTIIKTLHTGRHQKAAGAWSWSLWNENDSNMNRYGSSYTVTELLKYKTLQISYRFNWAIEIYGDEKSDK